jgi:hypothetical protein
VASVIAQVAALSAFWAKGVLDQGRMYRVLAALYGVDLITVQAQATADEEASREEQPSFDAKLAMGKLKSLDIDLREMAYDKGLLDVQNLLADLQTKEAQFQGIKQSWDNRLKAYAKEQQTSSMQELERTLEAIKPPQAKEQIVKMIENGDIDIVVGILKRMQIDKRRKIVAEFKAPNEAEMLHEILDKMRNGEPIASEIKKIQQDFEQINQGE